MKKNSILLGICLILSQSLTCAQEDEQVELFYSPFQFTFMFPPLSTNGMKNSKTVNKVSLNLFVGNSGAVDGVELGSFINTDNYYMEGFQGAGFINVVAGTMKGAQLAGFGNVTGGLTEGAQLSGFFNVAGEYNGGAQVAGFTSVNGGGHVHTQVSGFCNVARNVTGAQIGGFINVAENVRGVQVAGFINICDSIDGVPIGFINVVRTNGYRDFVFSLSETQYANISYIMGVRKLYNIYSLGKISGPGSRWMFGIGVGSQINVNEKMHLNIEAIAHQELWIADSRSGFPLHIDRLNMLNQARFLFSFTPSAEVNLFIGPTLNVSVSETSPDIGHLPYYQIGPNWDFYDQIRNNHSSTNVRIWIGIMGGIRL